MVWASASPAQARNSSPNVHFVADVPLLDCDGMPCIEARIGGHEPLRFAIDTGDQASILDSATARAQRVSAYTPDIPNWPKQYQRATIPELRIGKTVLRDVHLLTMDLSGFASKNQMPRDIAGTLAYTAFKDRILQIDFRARRVRISDVLTAAAALPGRSDSFSLITFGKHGPPIMVAHGFTVNGKPVTAQIDTMYSGSLLVYTDSIAKLGLTRDAESTNIRNFPFTDGGVKMKFAPARDEGFQGESLASSGARVYFPTPGVHEPDGLFDATVGLELFGNSVLTLDFHDMRVSVTS